jgi:hypothetical protein
MPIDKLIDRFLAWCSRHRVPATCRFYRTRLRMFRGVHGGREFATLSPLEIDEYLALADAGKSDSTKHHNAVALERLQKFALDHKLIDRPVFAKLEKPRVGQRDRLPTPDETAAILSRTSSDLRQCGVRPGELCLRRRLRTLTRQLMRSSCGSIKPSAGLGSPVVSRSARSWANCWPKRSGRAPTARSSCRRLAGSRRSATSAGRTAACATWPACLGTW